MAKRRQHKSGAGKASRIMTRILGALLMLFILVVLLFVGIQFLMADKEAATILTPQPATNPPVTQSNPDEAIGEGNNQVENTAKYSFYDALKQRSNEVEAEINNKISESEQLQKDIEGDNYRIQVGAFRSKDKADRLRARIILRDYPVMILRSNSMYLVQVGPYEQREDAVYIQKRLQREGMETLLKNYVAQPD